MAPPPLTAAWCLLALALPLPAEPFAAQDWRLRQDLTVRQPGPVKLALPVETLDAARPHLADLRLVDPAGQEVAFAVEQSSPIRPVVRAPRSLSGTVEDNAMVYEVETGTDDLITALAIDAGQQRFLTRALVESSEDGVTWRLLGRNLPVYDRGGPLRALELPIPPGVYARLRLSLDRLGGRHLALRGISLVTRLPRGDPSEPVPVRVTAREETAGATRLTLVLPGANLFLASLEIHTPERVFDRPVRLARRVYENEAIREVAVTRGALAGADPFPAPDPGSYSLPVEAIVPGRELILTIDNGDSPPLGLTAVTARRRPVFLIFEATAPGRYTLYAGNPRVAESRYDVGALATALQGVPPAPLLPGPLEANPDYRPGEPLPEIPLAAAPLEVAPWDFRKPVRIAAAGVQQLELDPDVLARAEPDLRDLRLVSDGRQVPFVIEHTSLTRPLDAAVTVVPDPKQPRLSRWRLGLPRPHLPLIRLSATAATPLFRRDIGLFEEMQDERGGTFRRMLGQAVWSQTPGSRRGELTVAFNQPPQTDVLWLETDNGDNSPVALGEVRVHYGVTRLLFKADDRTPIFLYYGNRRAAAPSYDLNLVAAQLLAADKSTGTLGAEEELRAGGLAQTLALAGRGGILFWSMLGLVVLILLAVIARLLPKTPPAGGSA
jgi:hypothetical protein